MTIYVVERTDPEVPEPQRLVDANSAAQALAHVVKPIYSVKVATPRECAALGLLGIEIETAKKGGEL